MSEKPKPDIRESAGKYEYRGGVTPERLAKELLRRVRPYEEPAPKPTKK